MWSQSNLQTCSRSPDVPPQTVDDLLWTPFLCSLYFGIFHLCIWKVFFSVSLSSGPASTFSRTQRRVGGCLGVFWILCMFSLYCWTLCCYLKQRLNLAADRTQDQSVHVQLNTYVHFTFPHVLWCWGLKIPVYKWWCSKRVNRIWTRSAPPGPAAAAQHYTHVNASVSVLHWCVTTRRNVFLLLLWYCKVH